MARVSGTQEMVNVFGGKDNNPEDSRKKCCEMKVRME
jgi:hypothetical protein